MDMALKECAAWQGEGSVARGVRAVRSQLPTPKLLALQKTDVAVRWGIEKRLRGLPDV